MTTPSPRFLDEDEPHSAVGRSAEPDAQLSHPAIDELARQGPLLLEPEPDAPRTLSPAWQPERISQPPRAAGTMVWFMVGTILLLMFWMLGACASAVLAAGSHSPTIGLVAGMGVGTSLGLIAYGSVLEWRAYRRLQHVERLRAALMSGPAPSVEAVRAAARAWLHRVTAHVPEADTVDRSLAAAGTAAEIVSILRNRVAEPLQAAALQLGRRAALEGAGLIAVSPHASWDGLIAGVRALLLIRQVASLYGLRPSTTVSLVLLRKVGATAIGTTGIELLSKNLADHALSHLPVARHLAGALPGTGVAALRLYRLAGIAAAACSPVPA